MEPTFPMLSLSLSGLQVPGPHHLAAEESPSFHLIQISSFANHSWTKTQGSGWLGDLQTHGWDSVLASIRFLRPWSQGNFSKEELKNIQALLQLYFHSFPREVQAYASQFQFECEFFIPREYSPEGSDHLSKDRWNVDADVVPCLLLGTVPPLLHPSPPLPLYSPTQYT